MSDAALITIKRAVLRNDDDRLYYIYEIQEDGSRRPIGRGYPHSTSCYAHLGRIVSAEALDDDLDDSLEALLRAHVDEANDRRANFFNFGMTQAEGMIRSKTSKGILITTLQPDGVFSHLWK